ncbi:hypothetical protein LCGC14_1642180, partial [marine sediment metagenome]
GKKLEHLLSFLNHSVTDFIRKGFLKPKELPFGRADSSEFKLTKKGKHFVEVWEVFNELEKSEDLETAVEKIVESFLSKRRVRMDQIMSFFYDIKKDEEKISIGYIRNHCYQVVNLRRKTIKIRKRMKSFPHEEYFLRPYDKNKLDKMLKSKFRRELNFLLKEDLDRLMKRKLLKFRRNRYRLTWMAEFKEK